jgi:glyoxylase-like metal-dependent hydrolase (beta-lactamase superfamily II)
VRLIPAPGGHTDADLLIHFTSSGVVHMGDLLLSESFPAVRNRVERYLEILDSAIDVFPRDATFIAGHGRDCTMEDVRAYRAMLLETIGVVKKHMQAGKTVEEMRQEELLKKWDTWGEFLRFLSTDYWIQAVHDSYAAELGA